MASQRGAKPSAPVRPADAASSATPAPFATLRATLTELPKGQVLRRVHQDQRRAGQFNPGARGNARFSPIRDDRGRPIPMLHGGATMDCALMETVFHDAPYTEASRPSTRASRPGRRIRPSRSRSRCGWSIRQARRCVSRISRASSSSTRKRTGARSRANGPKPFTANARTPRGCRGRRGRTIPPARSRCSATAFRTAR